ncbi:hypothetical protein OHA25_15235 [Nonomuraea sp. NBC_00507]|uniref:hypothetical protein n=1 Tax=Nonomuraea sp. NBC_00507 TaxID=2976002 RepID=UPI002E1910CC
MDDMEIVRQFRQLAQLHSDGSLTDEEKATVGVRDDAPANSKARFEVYGDGNRLLRKDLSFD